MLQFIDNILDNVHGYIALTEVEVEIEKLPIFRRLRRLKQLGIANWVFPGAEHTRYSHSLGVMHIADQMAIKLGFDDTERQLIRLAGMLHDIGHYPLSHVGESAYKEYGKLKNITTVPERTLETINSQVISSLRELENDEEKDPKYISHTLMQTDKNLFHHEVLGTYILRNNEQIKTIVASKGIDIEDICNIITGDISNPKLIKYVQLMHSELDADRIDYLLRDAASSGTSYGLFELNTLIKNLEIKRHSKYDIEIVGVNIKGVASADQFLLNRYFAYSQVVFNKNVAILNFMAGEIIYWMLNSNQSYFPDGDKLLRLIRTGDDDFIDFTDEEFVEKIRTMNIPNTCPELIKHMMEYLKRYTIPSLSEKAIKNNIVVASNQPIELHTEIEKVFNVNGEFEQVLLKLDEVYLTKHVKEEQYIEAYEKNGTFDDIEIEEYLRHRLINGIAVIDKSSDVEPCLLYDYPSSITKELCRHKTMFLRQFDFY